MDKALTARLSRMVEYGLPEKWTSLSYALTVGGELRAADALGHQGGRSKAKAHPDCTYNVASISKIYCTVAVMQLCERGLLALDEPVCRYLPRLWMPDERYRAITLRHCLNHASGLPGTLWRAFSVTDLQAAGDYYELVYDYCARNLLKAAPGEYSVYCNDGFTLAEMCVAAVSGQTYPEYLRDHVTGPLGCDSTRGSALRNGKYPLVCDGEKPAELLCIPGAGGLTTTMTDLCVFGNTFLGRKPLLRGASLAEMGRSQGRTFLPGDERTPDFGLGWDTVAFRDPNYDLGPGALRKGGNSFQFTSQLIILPKYDAVLAISETHDCNLELVPLALRLLAVALLEDGVNITRAWRPVPAELTRHAGVYLTPGGALELSFDGPFAELISVSSRGRQSRVFKTMRWDGAGFENADGQRLSFAEDVAETYLLLEDHGPVAPIAQKARPRAKLPVAWKKRIGKGYLPISADACDEVVGEMCSSLRLRRLKGCEGVMLACFPAMTDTGGWEMFDCPFAPVDGQMGTGFLRTPANGSRDAVTPIFFTEKGVEYCDVASYRYMEISFLPAWNGHRFAKRGLPVRAFVLADKLEKAPRIPKGRRVIVYDLDLTPVWDSLTGKDFKPVRDGYILLI